MADIKKVEYLRNSNGRAVKTAEALQPQLAAKMGLLPGMGVYKFFRVIYAERELAGCFASDKNGNCRLKKEVKKFLKTDEPAKENETGKISPVQLIKKCLRYASKKAYAAWQAFIKPLISKVDLPAFTKFADYQPSDEHFAKFDELARCP
ncbi:4250_t:CDS:2 [Paraglomus occultum]|uniref:4250_t:CDS:1 n=1 Tax=Paraglomus occultum TaxID=144539 RepID=A0A9N9CHJ8_9GLOM|nr:4250_t:CDS:2 [Paraglomus occultum]